MSEEQHRGCPAFQSGVARLGVYGVFLAIILPASHISPLFL